MNEAHALYQRRILPNVVERCGLYFLHSLGDDAITHKIHVEIVFPDTKMTSRHTGLREVCASVLGWCSRERAFSPPALELSDTDRRALTGWRAMADGIALG